MNVPIESMATQDSTTRDLIRMRLEQKLALRLYPKTICPSEVPRTLSISELRAIGVSHWRDLMPEVRKALWDMRDRGQVEILQRGVSLPNDISLDQVNGPIRARKT